MSDTDVVEVAAEVIVDDQALPSKRYAVMVQHEVIVYGPDEATAKNRVLQNPMFAGRHKIECTKVTEAPEDEEPYVVIENYPHPHNRKR